MRGDEKSSGYVSQDDQVQYDTLSIEEMEKLPVGQIVSDYLLMWTVGPFIREALRLFDAWGFTYKSQMVWTKSTGLGVGHWFRGDHELILVGCKKKSASIRTNVRSVFSSPRMRHSEKPENLHLLVEKHFPGPYLEIFGRKSRAGWVVLGNESPDDGQDIRESILKYVNKQEEPMEIETLSTVPAEIIAKKSRKQRNDKGQSRLASAAILPSVSINPALASLEQQAAVLRNQLEKIESAAALLRG
jgi:N6-adenosine-specific RNA methylase IME4